MKIYTKCEIADVIERAYMLGFQDGRNRRGTEPQPPRVEDVVDHPMTGNLRTPPAQPDWRHERGGRRDG